MEICKREDCTGCFACVNICPKSCITMKQNNIGHVYPFVNEKACIDCGLCQKTCPVNNPVETHTPTNAYACWSLNDEEHEKSTSGGIATYLTRRIIEDGGVVYGCSSTFSNEVHHIRVDSLSDIQKLQGSKYVHSYINDSYKNVKKDLTEKKQVLFIGTPCQVAGLYTFLGGKDYDDLITVDLICHGVPAQKLFFDHVNSNVDCDKEKTVSFREKEGFYFKISDSHRVLYRKYQYDDLYFLGFNVKLFYRDSCYNCKFANLTRCGNLTIGDFWGLGKDVPFEHKIENGVSVILINSKKGQEIIRKYKDGLFLEERDVDEAVKGNGQLNSPSRKHINAEMFAKEYKNVGFDNAVKHSLKRDIKKYKLLKFLQKSDTLIRIITKLKQ